MATETVSYALVEAIVTCNNGHASATIADRCELRAYVKPASCLSGQSLHVMLK